MKLEYFKGFFKIFPHKIGCGGLLLSPYQYGCARIQSEQRGLIGLKGRCHWILLVNHRSCRPFHFQRLSFAQKRKSLPKRWMCLLFATCWRDYIIIAMRIHRYRKRMQKCSIYFQTLGINSQFAFIFHFSNFEYVHFQRIWALWIAVLYTWSTISTKTPSPIPQ